MRNTRQLVLTGGQMALQLQGGQVCLFTNQTCCDYGGDKGLSGEPTIGGQSNGSAASGTQFCKICLGDPNLDVHKRVTARASSSVWQCLDQPLLLAVHVLANCCV